MFRVTFALFVHRNRFDLVRSAALYLADSLLPDLLCLALFIEVKYYFSWSFPLYFSLSAVAVDRLKRVQKMIGVMVRTVSEE